MELPVPPAGGVPPRWSWFAEVQEVKVCVPINDAKLTAKLRLLSGRFQACSSEFKRRGRLRPFGASMQLPERIEHLMHNMSKT